MKTVFNSNHQIVGYLNTADGLARTCDGAALFLIWPDNEVQLMNLEIAREGYGSIGFCHWNGNAVFREGDDEPMYYIQ
jgi:hypothetical protein